MSDPSRIAYVPRPDATPEGEIETLADVYSFILRAAQERKKGGLSTSRPNNTKVRSSSDDSRADKASIPR